MWKYLIFCLFLNGVLCGTLNKNEGAECEWDGVKGKCVKETKCLTTLDKRSDPHPICSTLNQVNVVCCTDCELVNDTSNVVLSPKTGYFWKDGSKARDSCLNFIDTLPYRCKDGGFYSGISKHYDNAKKCHTIGLWGVGGSPPPGSTPGAKYPQQALLGYGDSIQSAKWLAGGSIINEKFILTAAHVNNPSSGPLKFVALGVKKLSDPISSWKTYNVKRFIAHPEYKAPAQYHDIALIELETTITFNKDILPACLQVEDLDTEKATTVTWRNLKSASYSDLADTLQTIELEKFTHEECAAAYTPNRRLKNGINADTQICYGSRSNSPEACRGFSGEALMVDSQFSCAHTIIGVTTFGRTHCGGEGSTPDVFTRVAYYKSWIEQVAWP